MDREARDYWRQQRRRNVGRKPMIGGPFARLPATTIVIALMILGYIGFSIPSVEIAILSLPRWAFDLATSIDPGSFFGLILDGIFVYLLGQQVEMLLRPWQFVVTFIVAGGFGAFAASLLGPAFLGTMAPFGLAGVIAYAMATHPMVGRNQVFSWVIILLVLNFVLSGFSLTVLFGMIGAFLVGIAALAVFTDR